MSQEPLSPESTPTSARSKAPAASENAANQPTTKKSAANRADSSRSKPQALLQMLGQMGGIGLALVPVGLDLLRQLWRLILPILQWLGRQWVAVLPKIRTLLPSSLNKLPDSALTATAIALVLLLLLIPSAFSPDRSPAVAEIPTGTAIIDQPNLPPPVAARPNPNAKRIATLQNQLAEITTPYAEDLVQAVQADFARGDLLISVTDRWNALEASQREQLANELLKRSKKLKFERLDITDAEGILLARSPVVGSDMVLLVGMKAT